MWIHKDQHWPHFTWDTDTLSNALADVRYHQGLLLGKMGSLGFELKREATLNTLTSDVLKSSAIEGEQLNHDEVRSSIARRLGIDLAGHIPASRDVEGIVEMMIDATHAFEKPLTKERLFDWHAALFPNGRNGMHAITTGNWRTLDTGPMQVVSGPIGREKIHFEAPDADRLEAEMTAFLAWLEKNDTLDPILKAGVAHFWFVTIHPFEDGNGRIARAIADLLLARSDNTPNRFYSLSTQIESERKQYYLELEQQQRSTPDITNWLSWFIACLRRAIDNAEKTIDKVLFKAGLWEKLKQSTINERQQLIINRMLEDDFEGHMNTSKYAKMAKCSTDTALRDIRILKDLGAFIQNTAQGRSTSYRLSES